MKREEIEQHCREFHGIKNIPLTPEQIREVDFIQNVVYKETLCITNYEKDSIAEIMDISINIPYCRESH